ncbi:MAG TPA: ubiquitin-like domain-containing protein [Candidatus Baltobacteraceae bacterium]|nr:ubiquitin-like domain-containing protein [Candidatus Baltobacteraceae bacterium]
MIGRSLNRAYHLSAVALLTLGLVSAGFVTHPASAVAAALDVHAATRVVLFQSQGTQTQHVTSAQTVGEFLKERGIVPGPRDYVHPAAQAPLTDNLLIEYSPAVPVRLITASGTKTIVTTADDVGALLEEQGIQLGKHDIVRPSLADPIVAYGTVRISRVVKWVATEKRRVAERTIHEIDFSLSPGAVKIIRHGEPGVALTMVDYTQTDGILNKHVVGTRVLRKPKTRVVAEGVGTAGAVADFARYGLEKTAYIASGALNMVATAYTAGCAGCSGYTASGYRAGHGIVAVDPGVIPLGTRLYIPGYGFAIAGDTGGAIRGNRIDLGFDSIGDAVQFGRRPVKVYTLH